jgi:hypothetical protein
MWRIGGTMKYFNRLIVVALAVSASALFGGSITVGVNNGGNGAPFGAFSGTRYQEAYSGSLFSSPIAITGIDFFQSGAVGTLRGATYQLSLSTISASVNSLSNVNFDSNLGPDNAIFATLALSGNAPSVLIFTGGPFSYDPSQGKNLLLDMKITNPTSGATAFFKDENGSGPSTIARYQDAGLFGTVGYGLVTQFDSGAATSAPEPGTFVLLSVALIGMAGSISQKRKLHSCE